MSLRESPAHRLIERWLAPEEVVSLRGLVLNAAQDWPEDDAVGRAGELSAADHPALAALVPRLDAEIGLANHLTPYFRGRVAGPGASHPAHIDDYEIDGAKLVATAMIYLDTVEGGETVFQRAGLSVSPAPGQLLTWLNLDDSGEADPTAEHGISPIIEGTRITLTWFLYAPMPAAVAAAQAGRDLDPPPLIAALKQAQSAEDTGRALYCIDDGVPSETISSLYRACRRHGVRFVRVRPREVDPRRGPLAPGAMLYTPSTSMVAERVEQQLWQPGVSTFHRRPPGPFTSTLNPLLAFQRAGLPVPRHLRVEQAPGDRLEGWVDWLGGFPLVVKSGGGEGGVGTLIADSMPALKSLLDLLLSQGSSPLLMAYIPEAMHLRLVVVGDEVVTAYRNPIKAGDFRSTPSEDPADYEISVSPEVCALAVAATQVVGYAFAGVDVLLDTEGQPWLLEANFPCYFPQGEVYGADVSGRMVTYLLDL